MNYCDYFKPSTYDSRTQNGPCSSAMGTSTSQSANSVWSDGMSRFSDNSSVTSDPYVISSPPSASITRSNNSFEERLLHSKKWPVPPISVSVEGQHRQYSDRGSKVTRMRPSPRLIRQTTKKDSFVDSLIDSSTHMLEAIWPLSAVPYQIGTKEVLPLRTFIQETLRRSRTSYSTLQVTLYYLILIKPHVLKQRCFTGKSRRVNPQRALLCGRRMFLSALILASKYLQDRNFSAHAWSKISGLDILEINQNELVFLLAVDWKLHVTETIYQRWTEFVLEYISMLHTCTSAINMACAEYSATLKSIILELSPELENINISMKFPLCETTCSPSTSSCVSGPTSQSNMGFNTTEPSLTTVHYTPNFLEPSPTPSYPPNKIVPALGLLPTPRMTPQINVFKTPSLKTTLDEFQRAQFSGLMNKEALEVMPASYDKQAIFPVTLSPKSRYFKQDQNLLTPTFLISPPEEMNTNASRINLPSPKPYFSYQNHTPLARSASGLRLRRNQKNNREPRINLEETKLESRKFSIIKPSKFSLASGKNNSMEICPNTILRRGEFGSNHHTRGREVVDSPNRTYGALPEEFCLQDYSNFNFESSIHNLRPRYLFSESHPLASLKKRSATNIDVSRSAWEAGKINDDHYDSELSTPRKRACCAFEAPKSTIAKNLYPSLHKFNEPCFWS